MSRLRAIESRKGAPLPLRATALCLLCLLSGCVEDFAPASQIKDLRILAIKAEPPEARPGETVRLSTLVVDPSGEVLPPVLAWLVCFPDPIGGVNACATGSAPQQFAGFGVTEVDITIPADITLFPEGDPQAQSTVLATVVACTSADPDDCVACDDQGCEFGVVEGVEVEIALKRITVSNRSDEERNHNPQLAEVSAAAFSDALPDESFIPLDPVVPTPMDACEGLVLRSRAPQESFETFVREQLGEPVTITEQLITSYFITTGAVASDRIFNGVGAGVSPGVADVRYDLFPEERNPEGPIHLFFVLRDDRGGLDFAARELSLAQECAP